MVTFQEISPADFFYRNRDIAGFTNPSRAVFVSIREIVFGLVIILFLIFEPDALAARWRTIRAYWKLWPFSY